MPAPAKKAKKRLDTDLSVAVDLDPRLRRAVSILAACAVPGASISAVATAHGVTVQSVHMLIRRAKKGKLYRSHVQTRQPLDAAVGGDVERVEAVAEVVAPAITDALGWCTEVRGVGRRAVRFLNSALDSGKLDPANHNHVRVVGESILRVLAEIMRLNWLMTSGVNAPKSVLDRDIAELDDATLEQEARRALSEVAK